MLRVLFYYGARFAILAAAERPVAFERMAGEILSRNVLGPQSVRITDHA